VGDTFLRLFAFRGLRPHTSQEMAFWMQVRGRKRFGSPNAVEVIQRIRQVFKHGKGKRKGGERRQCDGAFIHFGSTSDLGGEKGVDCDVRFKGERFVERRPELVIGMT